MKNVRIEATFPDLKGNCYANAKGEASTTVAAISKAIRNLFKEPNVKGKRIRSVALNITITTGEENGQV